MKNRVFNIILICMLPGLACRKFVDIKAPAEQTVTGRVFENDSSALLAVIGLYSEMCRNNQYLLNGGVTFYAALTADELSTVIFNDDADVYMNNSIPPSNAIGLTRLWGKTYNHIYHANLVLESLNNSSNISAGMKQQLSGEMLFARAYCYFYLLNLFGDVPLILKSSYRENATAGRKSTVEVYAQIKRDLLAAVDALPETYVSAQKGRPNKWAAVSLLSRVYLYTAEWSKANETATMVLTSGMYSLETDLDRVFSPNSSETIWQFIRDNSNTADGNIFLPAAATAKPAFGLRNELLNRFEPGDRRKMNWIMTVNIGGQPYSYPYKYKIKTVAPVSEYLIQARLAELYLIRAEARIELSELEGARQDINQIRRRAGLQDILVNDSLSLKNAIVTERWSEFFTEFGHRWFDLKRTGKVNQVLSTVKGANWQSSDQLFPIPSWEITANPNLVQNPGY